jgi:hypothetical protein
MVRPCPLKISAGCVTRGLRAASPARDLSTIRRDRLIASRRAGAGVIVRAVGAAGVELKAAQSNSGMHPTANSVALRRETRFNSAARRGG